MKLSDLEALCDKLEMRMILVRHGKENWGVKLVHDFQRHPILTADAESIPRVLSALLKRDPARVVATFRDRIVSYNDNMKKLRRQEARRMGIPF